MTDLAAPLVAETVTGAKRRASTNVTIVELGIVFVEQVVGMVVAELVDALLELLLNTSARGSHSIRPPGSIVASVTHLVSRARATRERPPPNLRACTRPGRRRR
jgi:hypothetical protein